MSWRFRKRVKVIPGLYLNISKRGISTTIGPRGFSVNISSKGSYLNAGIPGLGISQRIPLSVNEKKQLYNGSVQHQSELLLNEKLSNFLEQYCDGLEQIESLPVERLTSNGFQVLKTAIIAAHKEYAEIVGMITEITAEKQVIDKKRNRLKQSIFRFLFKKRIERLTHESGNLADELAELEEQKELSVVDLTVKNEDVFELLYQQLEQTFGLVIACSKIWDITASKDVNRIQERSFADTQVSRAEVKAVITDSGLIRSLTVPLKLYNRNGGDLFFYPGFVIIHEQQLSFAIVDYADFDVKYRNVQFVETETIPGDAKVVGNTWAKVNKNGTPDKRFKGNYQIPLTQYAQIDFESGSGIRESYMFSNALAAHRFYLVLKEYLAAVKKADTLLNQTKK